MLQQQIVDLLGNKQINLLGLVFAVLTTLHKHHNSINDVQEMHIQVSKSTAPSYAGLCTSMPIYVSD